MFSHISSYDCPIRVRTKLPEDAAGTSSNNRNTSKRLMPLTLNKPWFMGNGISSAASAACVSTNHHNNTIRSDAASAQRWASRYNTHNAAVNDTHNAAAKTATENDNKAHKEEIKPMPYHDYNPIVVHHVQSDQELPIHYWFYVYLYSSDVDRLLTPFVKMVDAFGTDRRLTVIMNRCGVQIMLKDLELYKSLPRRIVVIKASQWCNIVKALIEMEDRLPDLMRFATFPLLLDTDTTKFACTKFDRTACINRLTKPIY